MDKSLLPSLNTPLTRLAFIEKTLNMNEKVLLSKLNSTNTIDQSDMLEFLHNNNSTIHSSNRKIIQGSHSNIKAGFSYTNVFDKALDNYIMQYSLFPFIETESKDRIDANTSKNEKKSHFAKSSKLKIYRENKIEKYLERKRAYNKGKNHQRGISCFSCFGHRIHFNNQQQNSPSTCKDDKSFQILIDKDHIKISNNDVHNNNHLIQNTNNIPFQKQMITDFSNTQMNNSGNGVANELLNLKDNSIHASNKTIILNVFPLSTKAITFILTTDIVKAITIISKSSNEEYIIHSYTYLFDKNAFVNDLYFYELKLRTNIEKNLLSKNVKYPLILYGNVFLPQVVFFRGDEEVNFQVLDYPVVSPMIIAQLIPDSFLNNEENTQTINTKIIEEALSLSDELDYEIILVSLIPIAEINQIFSVIKMYIEIINNNKSFNYNSVNFLLNMTTSQFQSYVMTSGVPHLLEKANIKTTVVSL